MENGAYEERFSPAADAIVWTRAASGTPQSVLPDGCMDLIWMDGQLVVAGPDTRAHLAGGAPGTRYTGLRFPPGHGPALLSVPAHELRDLRVPLAGLWPDGEVRRLAERVAEAQDQAVALEKIAASRRAEAPRPDDLLAGVVAGLRSGAPVAAVAAEAGLSERQLHRRCLAAFGYGPKTLSRVLRFNRALALARTGMPFAEVAAAAGYADQSHLARETRSLAGVALRELLP